MSWLWALLLAALALGLVCCCCAGRASRAPAGKRSVQRCCSVSPVTACTGARECRVSPRRRPRRSPMTRKR
jgi:hypothetical protein